MTATRDQNGSYAMIYFPRSDQSAVIDMAKLSAQTVRGWWYDPRTGTGRDLGALKGPRLSITSPTGGPDWVLVLDDPRRGYPPPGLKH